MFRNDRLQQWHSSNDWKRAATPDARLWSGHDDQHEDGPSCKRSPVPLNGRAEDVRYLALISMVVMTAKGTMRSSTSSRLPELGLSIFGTAKTARAVGQIRSAALRSLA